ncbi:Fpg/Nei family DNA glycosylase [Pseudonocardiaceae bacterium YIM PH 21723]|nr:Fpg/Nei family DNA glycosylase [Pseudonocardiaceae bacterium YIM PH 21723]
MPEGDTVFLSGKRLDEALSGRRLTRGELRHPRLSTVDLTGREVSGVASVGKHLFTRFTDGLSLHSHFKMDGSFHLYRPGARFSRPDHQIRAILATANHVAVGFLLHDLELLPTADEGRLVGHLGPDLLAEDWDPAEAVHRLSADGDQELGLALLDQRIMAGVGNVYRAEICFLLRVSPFAPVSTVDPAAVVALARKLLLVNAWRPERSTTGDLGRGRQLWVYERGGKACLRCRSRIERHVQGTGVTARNVWLCPRCQG